jgi:hypothetical protein
VDSSRHLSTEGYIDHDDTPAPSCPLPSGGPLRAWPRSVMMAFPTSAQSRRASRRVRVDRGMGSSQGRRVCGRLFARRQAAVNARQSRVK